MKCTPKTPNSSGLDEPGPRLKVLMGSLEHYGRAQSLVAIASELIRRGHEVTFAASHKFVPKIRSMATGEHASKMHVVGLGDASEDTDESNEQLNNKLRSEFTKEENSDKLSIVRLVCAALANDALDMAPQYRKLIVESNFDMIVSDVSSPALMWGNEMAGHKKLPVVVNHPILAQGELSFTEHQGGYYPSANERVMDDGSFSARVKNVVRRRIGRTVLQHTLSSIFNPARSKLGLPPHLNQYPTIVGSAFGFELPHELPPHMKHFGPMIDESTVSWDLAEKDPHVQWASDGKICPEGTFLVSLGTSVRLDAGELNSLADALIEASTNVTEICFLWSLKEDQQNLLHESAFVTLNKNPHFKFATFVQTRLFLRWAPVVGHLSHGGVASVSESLYFGVPLVVLPFLFDQVDLAARVAHAGAGVDIGPDRPHNSDNVRRGIIAVITDSKYRHGAEKVGRIFRHAGGVKYAADLVESVHQLGAEHLMPLPYRNNAPWYAHTDTDVVVVLTGVGLIFVVAIVCCL
eukprot:CAMPEP_0183326712 /NCGR_PEP_ID=MMETSP0160_2-20130417/82955_1 /TAXON_ID=2839 ORGANISM="Odontella Sinensis, Strain Grunow 1884" /NCGR_SAMPLE_ID=MMETSP0160_2 /ASSEMBLY_ACC=CAM_ASM_000250 /LENGTH=520 /DNA_ID=CAMNT_0025494761 /DNA_START=79 /DNA_END=1637 /DNA_ORIENTATION=+